MMEIFVKCQRNTIFLLEFRTNSSRPLKRTPSSLWYITSHTLKEVYLLFCLHRETSFMLILQGLQWSTSPSGSIQRKWKTLVQLYISTLFSKVCMFICICNILMGSQFFSQHNSYFPANQLYILRVNIVNLSQPQPILFKHMIKKVQKQRLPSGKTTCTTLT